MNYVRMVARESGGPEVLELVEEAVPEPGEGSLLVRMLAAGAPSPT